MDDGLIIGKQMGIRALHDAAALLRQRAATIRASGPRQQMIYHASRLEQSAASMSAGNALAQDDLIRNRDHATALDRGVKLPLVSARNGEKKRCRKRMKSNATPRRSRRSTVATSDSNTG